MDRQLAKIIVGKMVKAANLSKQEELAELLGIKPQSISSNIAKGKIPDGWFAIFHEKFGVTKDQLSETPGEKLVRTYGKNPVTSSVSPSWRNEHETKQTPEIGKALTDADMPDMVKMTMEILASDTVYKSALASNIRAFHQAVNMEKEMQSVNEKLANMEKQMERQTNEMAERMARLEEMLLSFGATLPEKREQGQG